MRLRDPGPIMSRPRLLKTTALLLALAMPALVWATVKYVRILAPGLNGMVCLDRVCVEDPSTYDQALALQRNALDAVSRKLGSLNQAPLTAFCSSRRCYHAFGAGMERGAAILDWGVILPPESWVPHIVEHEYIHMLQAQELGLWGRERTPDWFKEGMAFFVSEPPDHDLPDYARPLTEQYQAWEAQVGRENVWQAAQDLRRR